MEAWNVHPRSEGGELQLNRGMSRLIARGWVRRRK